jgi:hypothetical protein
MTANGADDRSYSDSYSRCPAEEGSYGSTVSVDTELGSVYYASVLGYAGTVGTFGLRIFDDIPDGQRILPEEVISYRTDGSFTIN